MLLCSLWALPGCLPPLAPTALVAEPKTPQVTVTRTSLIINQAIYFAVDEDRILPVSFPILDELCRTLRAQPEIQRVRIEGHTDSTGTPTYNLNLSGRRAQSVLRYLTRAGVAGERLRAVGFGQSQPIADNDAEDGRARNRRVSFIIEQWGGAAHAEARR